MELSGNSTEIQFPIRLANEATTMNMNIQIRHNKIISLLSHSRAKDTWGLDTVFLKKHKYDLTTPITHIINWSFDESTFPSSLKTTIVYWLPCSARFGY